MECPISEDSYIDKEGQMKPMRKVLMLAYKANYLRFTIIIMNLITRYFLIGRLHMHPIGLDHDLTPHPSFFPQLSSYTCN